MNLIEKAKQGQNKSENMIFDFERQIGLKLKNLNNYEDQNDEAN